MGYHLRPGLHFCEADSSYIFLDLDADRYFRLPPTIEDHFRNLVNDPLSACTAAPPLLEAGLLCASPFRQNLSRPRLLPATSTAITANLTGLNSLEVARALSSEIWISQRLRHGGLSALTASYLRAKVGRMLTTPVDHDGPSRIVRAYEVAKLFRTPANRCLSRSLAMARRLTSCRCNVLLVIGVRARPFTAHCWVQSGDTILNDTPDEVSRYTPIFFA